MVLWLLAQKRQKLPRRYVRSHLYPLFESNPSNFLYQASISTPSTTLDGQSLPHSKGLPTEPQTPPEEVRSQLLRALEFFLYLCPLLALPALYSSRVRKIFRAANGFMAAEINRPRGLSPTTSALSDAPHKNLKAAWDSFIDSLMTEWQTSNIISVLLLSCVQFNEVPEFY